MGCASTKCFGTAPPAAPLSPKVAQRLVFSSISTAIFQFDIEKAAPIIAESVAAFLKAHPVDRFPDMSLTLIGIDKKSLESTKVAWKALHDATSAVPDSRFTISHGDITEQRQRGTCAFIANAANARLEGGLHTGGVNRAIFVAAGAAELEKDSLKAYPNGAKVGPAYPVRLRPTSPLHQEGVRYVIHVLGPNMNPSRPNCLHGDYTVGCQQLRDVYTNLFASFDQLCSTV